MHTVLLMRHGESTWNTEDRVQGWAPTPLTDRGVRQARDVGALVAERFDVDRVVASDLRRTRETTVQALDAAGLAIEPEYGSRFRERAMGTLQGLTVEQVYGDNPEYSLRDSGIHGARACPPGGESFLDMRERVLDGWEELVATTDSRTTMVVTHGGPIFAILAHLWERSVVETLEDGWASNGSIVEISIQEGRAAIRETDIRPADPAPRASNEASGDPAGTAEPAEDSGQTGP